MITFFFNSRPTLIINIIQRFLGSLWLLCVPESCEGKPEHCFSPGLGSTLIFCKAYQPKKLMLRLVSQAFLPWSENEKLSFTPTTLNSHVFFEIFCFGHYRSRLSDVAMYWISAKSSGPFGEGAPLPFWCWRIASIGHNLSTIPHPSQMDCSRGCSNLGSISILK